MSPPDDTHHAMQNPSAIPAALEGFALNPNGSAYLEDGDQRITVWPNAYEHPDLERLVLSIEDDLAFYRLNTDVGASRLLVQVYGPRVNGEWALTCSITAKDGDTGTSLGSGLSPQQAKLVLSAIAGFQYQAARRSN